MTTKLFCLLIYQWPKIVQDLTLFLYIDFLIKQMREGNSDNRSFQIQIVLRLDNCTAFCLEFKNSSGGSTSIACFWRVSSLPFLHVYFNFVASAEET